MKQKTDSVNARRRLLIIRNPDSPLLDYLDLDRADQEIFLMQNAVYSKKLRGKKVKLLDEDARARKMEANGKLADYGNIVDAIFAADGVFVL